MLAVSFFTLVFSSLIWLIFALRYISDSLAGTSFFAAGAVNILIYVLLVCLPVLVMWLIFGFINNYLHSRQVNRQLQRLFGQMKRNQDYSDLVARVLIETEQQVKDGFLLGKFDLLISDMNELLAEIIHCSGIASSEQIERLWSKVQNGGKWSFGKVIIEVNNAQPNFQMRVYEKACHDIVMAGTIMEFCARYQAVVGMLEQHDKEKVFLNIIEAGVMGKVYSIMAPIAAEVRKVREAGKVFRPAASAAFKVSEPEIRPQPESSLSPLKTPPLEEEAPKSILGKINPFKKRDKEASSARVEPGSRERDAFSVALERSFGTPEEAPETPRLGLGPALAEPEVMSAPEIAPQPELQNEPRFEINLPEDETPALSASAEPRITIEPPFEPEITTPMIEPSVEKAEPEIEPPLTSTQKTLENLRKEWDEFKSDAPSSAKVEEENLAYPFGGWVDEQNYHK